MWAEPTVCRGPSRTDGGCHEPVPEEVGVAGQTRGSWQGWLL